MEINITEENRFGSMILPDGKYYSLDDKQTRLNNNVMVVGTTGSAKTRTVITPNLLECVGSYVVTDPKGNLYRKWGGYMRRQGYRVLRLSFIHPEWSEYYNPLWYIHTSQDVQKLSHALVYGTEMGCGRNVDPFWDQATVMFLDSIIGYLCEVCPKEDRLITNVLKLVRMANLDDEYDDNQNTPTDLMMKELEKKNPDSWALQQYRNFRLGAGKTIKSILITTTSKLSSFDTRELRRMLRTDDLDLASIGQRKTAVFVEVSDSDRSMDALINLFFTQAMNELCSYADEKCSNSELPVPVRFFMDDFATNCRIDNFENMISNIRSRKISAVLVLQSFSQLAAGYGENAHTIADDCDTLIYMGGNDPTTAQEIAVRVNKTANTILHMPLSTSWIIRRGSEPFSCHNFELDDYLSEKGIVDRSRIQRAV